MDAKSAARFKQHVERVIEELSLALWSQEIVYSRAAEGRTAAWRHGSMHACDRTGWPV